MAIIVEDGTGLATANSYVSLADADAYHEARGNSAWSAETSIARESALIRATAALDGRFRFRGVRCAQAQALAWPRFDATDDDGFVLEGVPVRLANACAEAALLEAVTPGTLTPTLDRGGQTRREKVGAIEIEYGPGASPMARHVALEGLLRGLTDPAGLRLRRG